MHTLIDWSEIYGLLATTCGWTFREIDRLTFPEFHQLAQYWQDHPPVHLLLASLCGLKAKKSAELSDLIAAFGEAGGAVNRTGL